MINLTPLSTKIIDEFDKIHNSKRNPTKRILTALKPSLSKRFNEYERQSKINDLEAVTSLAYSDSDKKALQNCYKVKTKALETLIKNIKENQPNQIRSVCQFCCINTDSTIDHYMPKEEFPEFSVAHLNLIPCCPDCNSKKSISWLSASKKRVILNLYNDLIPCTQFLFVDVMFKNDIPIGKYYLSNKNNIDNDLYRLIQSHYEKLELVNRYNDKFNTNYTQILNSLNNPIFKGNPKLVTSLLVSEYQNGISDFGINNYKLVLKEELARNNHFINLIVK